MLAGKGARVDVCRTGTYGRSCHHIPHIMLLGERASSAHVCRLGVCLNAYLPAETTLQEFCIGKCRGSVH